MQPILSVIVDLIAWYGYASIAEIAKISKKQQKYVLSVLLRNKARLTQDKRGRIIGFHDVYGNVLDPKKVYISDFWVE